MNNIDYTELAEAYIQWNRALLNHFFQNEEGNQRVDVTNDILNQVGEKYGLGNANDFLSTVCIPKEIRSEIYRSIRKHLRLTILRTRVSVNIWACAADLYAVELERERKGLLLYFNYVVLLMYIAHEYITTPDIEETNIGIGTYIKDYIKRKTGEDSNYAYAEQLFTQLSNDKPQFGYGTLTSQRYIGLIRYQLGLTQKQQTELYKALYRCDDLDGLTYDEQCDALKTYASDNLKKILNREDLKALLSEQIEIFDRDVYIELHPEEKKERNRDLCVLAMSFEANSAPSLVLLTNVVDRNISGVDAEGNTFVVRNCDYTYGLYNSNPVLINGSEKVHCLEYRLGNQLKTISLGNVAFFQEIRSEQNQDRVFVTQTQRLVAKKHAYAIVRKLKKGDVDKYVREWEEHSCFKENGFIKITSGSGLKIFQALFGDGWEFYCTSDVLRENCIQYYDVQTTQSSSKRKKESYGFVGGIPFERKKYLFNALPYLKLPVEKGQNLQLQDVNCLVRFGGKTLVAGKEYGIVLQNNLFFIDLYASVESDAYSKPLEIKVIYRQETYTANIWVRRVAIAHDQSALMNYNQWGQTAIDDAASICLQGSIINGIKLEPISPNNYLISKGSADLSIGQYYNQFYLVTLLSAYCYLKKDNNHKITHSTFVKCVQYVCTRLNLPAIEDANELFVLSDFLTIAGYMNIDYTSSSKRYQLVPPSLIEVPQGWDKHAFLLTGAYTYTFLTDFTTFCAEQKISVKVKKRDNEAINEAIKQILPPTILVHRGIKDKISLFKERYPQHSSLTLISGLDYPLSLIKYCNGVEQYEKTLTQEGSIEVIDDPLFVPTYTKRFPQVRIMANTLIPNSAQYILTQDLKYYKSSVSDVSYLWLYASYKRGECPLVARSTSGKVQIGLRDGRVPYLFRRAIYLMGLEPMKKQKVFVINSNNAHKPLYEDMSMCQIDDNNQNPTRTRELVKKLAPKYIYKPRSLYGVRGILYKRKDLSRIDAQEDLLPNRFIELITKDDVRIFATNHYSGYNSHSLVLLKYYGETYTTEEANLNRAISNALVENNLRNAGYSRTDAFSYADVERWIQSNVYTQEPIEVFEELTAL